MGGLMVVTGAICVLQAVHYESPVWYPVGAVFFILAAINLRTALRPPSD
jgi:hypothetical protein